MIIPVWLLALVVILCLIGLTIYIAELMAGSPHIDRCPICGYAQDDYGNCANPSWSGNHQ